MVEPFECPVGVATRPGLWPKTHETVSVAPTLGTDYGPDGWMDFNLNKGSIWVVEKGPSYCLSISGGKNR